MKTTIEIPDPLFRKAKIRAAERGQSLKQFFTEALIDKLSNAASPREVGQPEWMRGFGQLRRLKGETAKIMTEIEEAFGRVEPEDKL